MDHVPSEYHGDTRPGFFHRDPVCSPEGFCAWLFPILQELFRIITGKSIRSVRIKYVFSFFIMKYELLRHSFSGGF